LSFDRVKIISVLDKIILFSLYGIAYFLPISKAIIESLSTLAIFCFVLKKIIQRQAIPKKPLNLAIFSYLIICFLSIFISSNFKVSSRTFVGKTLQEVLFFFVIIDVLNTEKRIKNFICILLASSTLLGIDGIYQYFNHKDFIRHRPFLEFPRIYATFPTPNDFGCYLVSVIPFALICFFAKVGFKLFRFFYLGLFLLLFTCILLTVSRGAWIAFLSAMLFMSIWIRVLSVFFLAVGIFIATTHQFYFPVLKNRLSNFFIFSDSIDYDRRAIWQAAWKMFMSKPWIGLGLGTFMHNFNKFVTPGYRYGIPYAHNCYLQMSCEIGIIGLASFLLILTLFFYEGIKIIRNQQKTFFWYILVASLAAVLGYSVQMAVDTTFYSLDLGLLFWILLGLGIAAMKNIKLETVTHK